MPLIIRLCAVLFCCLGTWGAVRAESPLDASRRLLLDSPMAVKYVGMRFFMPDLRLEMKDMVLLGDENLASGFNLAALDRAVLMVDSQELTDILNSFNGKNGEDVLRRFEMAYFEKHKRYPDLAPVDAESLRRRLLNSRVLR
jgi:hypothetical protein